MPPSGGVKTDVLWRSLSSSSFSSMTVSLGLTLRGFASSMIEAMSFESTEPPNPEEALEGVRLSRYRLEDGVVGDSEIRSEASWEKSIAILNAEIGL